MRLLAALLLTVATAAPSFAQPSPGLRFEVTGGPVPASANPNGCDTHESPDAPARAIRLADGSVQLYATDQVNQLLQGPDLLHLSQRCTVVYRGGGHDDPADFDDRSWLATPWTFDGRTIWAIVHDEFHGELRKPLCPTGRYMDCWYNALTLAVSTDGGLRFRRAAPPSLVAAVPYRYDEVGLGHHGYFNPSNLVQRGGFLYMTAFVTRTGAQTEGNCLLRTPEIADAGAWRAWNGTGFSVALVDPYAERTAPEAHLCTPVGKGSLRWPVTGLVRHRPSGLFVAVMQDTSEAGAVYAATSPDLIDWSAPVRLLSTTGVGGWRCGDAAPVAYPSLLDPASEDRNFQTIGDEPALFAARFDPDGCRRGRSRTLVRWQVGIFPASSSQ